MHISGGACGLRDIQLTRIIHDCCRKIAVLDNRFRFP
jgi:hypothetical protein